MYITLETDQPYVIVLGCSYSSSEFWPPAISCIQEDMLKKKVKVTLVQALRLCTGCTAHRGRRGIALPFLDHGTRRG
jgi:hypothetical protein